MDSNEIEAMEANLSEIPPSFLLIDATADQIERWHAIKTRYSMLRGNLKAYFSGEKVKFEGLSKVTRDFFMLERDRWIAFYTLVQYAWPHIQDLAVKHEISLDTNRISTPGKALIAAIEQSAQLHLHPAYSPYYRWTPSDKRKQVKLSREAIRLKALQETGQALSSKDSQKIASAQKQWQKLDREIGRYQRVEQLCLVACWEKEGSDQRIRQYLRAFEKAEQEIFRLLESKMLHPSQKVKGEEWRNGQKALMDRYGGKPLNRTSQ